MLSIFNTVLTNQFSVGIYLACLLCAGLCGAVAALALSRDSASSRSFLLSLVVLPIIVTTVIVMVNGSVGTGIAVAGAFSLVRFRSAAGRAKDISAIFLVMTAGLACAAGYLAVALLFTVIASLVAETSTEATAAGGVSAERASTAALVALAPLPAAFSAQTR